MKIPFDIKYRPEIESGKYKVVTVVDNKPVRIICWDRKSCYKPDGQYIIYLVDHGREEICVNFPLRDCEKNLEIITDEPEELTEFEEAVKKVLLAWCVPVSREPDDSFVKEKSSELLTLAKETLEKEGWVGDLRKGYYKKGYEDAMRVLGEISTCRYTPPIPPCFVGGPCTNPQHDCINCPQQAPAGICKTNTKID